MMDFLLVHTDFVPGRCRIGTLHMDGNDAREVSKGCNDPRTMMAWLLSCLSLGTPIRCHSVSAAPLTGP